MSPSAKGSPRRRSAARSPTDWPLGMPAFSAKCSKTVRIPTGPSYSERSRPCASRTCSFWLEAKIDIGRVCGTSASIAPRVTRPVMSSRRAMSMNSEAKACQVRAGSAPVSNQNSGPGAGSRGRHSPASGHVSWRRPSASSASRDACLVVESTAQGRRSARGRTPTMSAAPRWRCWPLPPASFQPSKAAMTMRGPRTSIEGSLRDRGRDPSRHSPRRRDAGGTTATMGSVSRKPSAVLWDMDGTLVDTEPYWMAAETALVESFGGS